MTHDDSGFIILLGKEPVAPRLQDAENQGLAVHCYTMAIRSAQRIKTVIDMKTFCQRHQILLHVRGREQIDIA